MGEWEQQAGAKEYGQFMIEIFDEWYAILVRLGCVYWAVAHGVLGMQPSLCIFRKTCGDQMIVEQNGDIFSCDHYVYPHYKIGN